MAVPASTAPTGNSLASLGGERTEQLLSVCPRCQRNTIQPQPICFGLRPFYYHINFFSPLPSEGNSLCGFKIFTNTKLRGLLPTLGHFSQPSIDTKEVKVKCWYEKDSNSKKRFLKKKQLFAHKNILDVNINKNYDGLNLYIPDSKSYDMTKVLHDTHYQVQSLPELKYYWSITILLLWCSACWLVQFYGFHSHQTTLSSCCNNFSRPSSHPPYTHRHDTTLSQFYYGTFTSSWSPVFRTKTSNVEQTFK